MTAWDFLMLICVMMPLPFGWLGGKPAGIVGIVIGLLIGLVAGAGGVWAMYSVHKQFEGWLDRRKLDIKVQIVIEVIADVVGLAWCMAIATMALFVTRLVTHYVVA